MKQVTKCEECDTLLIAVIQAQDMEIAQDALNEVGVFSTRLPSIGGFLGRRNATLLIGLNKKDQTRVMQTLQDNCRQRIEYIAVPLESAPLPLPTPTPITIGGATVFALDVEHFEVI
jgi:uncharacterized protein YaaQ